MNEWQIKYNNEWQIKYDMLLEENKILRRIRDDFAQLQRENASLRNLLFLRRPVKDRIYEAILNGYRTSNEIVKYAGIAKSSFSIPLHQLLRAGEIRRRGPYTNRKDRSVTQYYYGRALKKERK